MSEVTLLDLMFSDLFCEIQDYLSIYDLFNLRCVCSDFRSYIDKELRTKKTLKLQSQDERAEESFKVLSDKCCSLEIINLSRNVWLRDDMLMPMLDKNAKSIVSLNLNECTNLTSVALQPVIIGCKNIRKLSLQNFNLTVGCLETFAFHQTNLQELDLGNCRMISERSIILLLNNFTQLRTLSLASVANVNDNVLFNISKYETEIVNLNLFSCALITDRGIGALSLNCKKLESLSIRGCRNITERSLTLLRSRNVHIDVPRTGTNQFINFIWGFEQINPYYLQV